MTTTSDNPGTDGIGTASAESTSPARRSPLRQRVAKTARWLHIYLSMVSFAIVLFFAVTGLTLNHPDWFASSIRTTERVGTVAPALLAQPENKSAQQALVALLRSREHLHGTVDEVRVDDATVSFSFRAPGYSADIAIDRATHRYTLTEVRNGFVAVLNDLHKGRDAGPGWGWLIDISAVLLTLVSLTGLLILWFLYKRRASGFVVAALGAALSLLLYRILVP